MVIIILKIVLMLCASDVLYDFTKMDFNMYLKKHD